MVIVFQICMVTFMISVGIQEATAALIGNQVGALNIPLAQRYGKIIMGWALAIGIFVSTILYIFRESIAGLFTDDPALIPLVLSTVTILVVANVLDSILLTVQGCVRALGI